MNIYEKLESIREWTYKLAKAQEEFEKKEEELLKKGLEYDEFEKKWYINDFGATFIANGLINEYEKIKHNLEEVKKEGNKLGVIC